MDWDSSGGTRSGFAESVLIQLGGYPITDENKVAMVAWMAAEGTKAQNNPLATTQPADGATDFNSVHVKNYPTWAAGIDATVKTLKNGHYPAILAALKNGTSAEAVASAVVASPWGTGALVKTLVPQVRANPRKYDIKVNADPNRGEDPGQANPEFVPGVPDFSLPNPLEAIGKLLSLLLSWDTWRRVLMVVGGGVAFAVGVALIAGDSPTVQQAATAVALA